MGMYVIDAKRRLWRVDRDEPDDAESLPVERPRKDGAGWDTARLNYHEVVVDPTDGELADLPDAELALFGMSAEQLLGDRR
jgi:hypothetical protein